MIAGDDLQRLIAAWMPAQRWYAGKGRQGSVRAAPFATLSDRVEIWIVRVTYSADEVELYQLPLVSYDTPCDSLEHVLLGTVQTADGIRWVYDALHDKDVTADWITSMRDARDDTAGGTTDGLRFASYGDADLLPVHGSSLVLTGEQSNTSLKYDDTAIMKVFRRLQSGVNPEIEVGAKLTEMGARHVPRLMGSAEAVRDGEAYAIAILHEYMTTATDGWELAKHSVADLMAEADLHADEAGGDFAGESYRLGIAVAETHADLAEAFGTRPPRDLSDRAAAMHARLDAAVEVVPQLGELAEGLHAIYDDFARASSEIVLQRIHGDLHLGQALRTVSRWILIDWEGEPMADLGSRRLEDAALRDVAGMLRSFEYAGHHRIIEDHAHDEHAAAQLAYRAAEWTQRNREAFLDGYAHAAADPREHPVPLRAYEADKAVYEAVYEARNRPAWLAIPLASLSRLADAPDGSQVGSGNPSQTSEEPA